MRKIIALEFISLDGVMQAPGGPEEDMDGGFKFGGWTFPYSDDESGKMMQKQMTGEYDLLLGRKTYDIFASYWPTHAGDFWPQVNQITKYVASNTLKESKWENTEILDGEIVEKIKKIKEKGDRDIQIYGSGNLVQTLLKNELIDELWLKIHPVILGKGKKMFGDDLTPATFELIKSRATSSGVIFANYKRVSGEIKTGSLA